MFISGSKYTELYGDRYQVDSICTTRSSQATDTQDDDIYTTAIWFVYTRIIQ